MTSTHHLIVRQADPFNAEPPPARLLQARTPEPDFYVRNHGPMPTPGPDHVLEVGGAVTTPLRLSLAELRTGFPTQTVPATLACAGNRRTELDQVRPVSGVPWSAGAIGTADWTGARLAGVLVRAGAAAAGHVAFEGADHCAFGARNVPYGVSIPMEKALAEEVLLAFAMNGEPLTQAHGAPLRAVVPGYAGARSAKWLRRITVQEHPSENPFQAEDYKLFPPDVTKDSADWTRATPINAMPVTSAICEPEAEAALAPGPVRLRGYAFASGRAIARVEVSADDGERWAQATLEPAARWTWTLWQAELALPAGRHTLAVRAWDDAGQTQPRTMAEVWNWKGYLASAWHRVPVVVRA